MKWICRWLQTLVLWVNKFVKQFSFYWAWQPFFDHIVPGSSKQTHLNRSFLFQLHVDVPRALQSTSHPQMVSKCGFCRWQFIGPKGCTHGWVRPVLGIVAQLMMNGKMVAFKERWINSCVILIRRDIYSFASPCTYPLGWRSISCSTLNFAAWPSKVRLRKACSKIIKCRLR